MYIEFLSKSELLEMAKEIEFNRLNCTITDIAYIGIADLTRMKDNVDLYIGYKMFKDKKMRTTRYQLTDEKCRVNGQPSQYGTSVLKSYIRTHKNQHLFENPADNIEC